MSSWKCVEDENSPIKSSLQFQHVVVLFRVDVLIGEINHQPIKFKTEVGEGE